VRLVSLLDGLPRQTNDVGLEGPCVDRSQAPGPFLDAEVDALVLAQGAEPVPIGARVIDEDVLPGLT
jgi:hypothetical protein